MTKVYQVKSNTKIINAKFAGICQHCGGSFEKDEEIKFHFAQRSCYHPQCPTDNALATKVQQREDIADQKQKTNKAMSYNVPALVKIFNGKFTVPFIYNNKDHHVTLWITTRSKKHHFPGSRRIRVLHKKEYVDIAYITIDGDLHFLDSFLNFPDMSKVKFEATIKAVDILMTGNDQESYGMYFALLSHKCWRCGKVLTNPDTLNLTSGCGPICDKIVEKLGISHDKTQMPEKMILTI